MSLSTQWTPDPGELVWLLEEKSISMITKHDLPVWAPNHLAVVVYVTPGEDAQRRSVWLLPVSSPNPKSDKTRPFLHFQYEYTPPVEEHGTTKCSTNCHKFLYLKPDCVGVPDMNKGGFIDTRKIYELPLSCVKRQRGSNDRKWQLRACSFNVLIQWAARAIAAHVTFWQPRYKGQMLCQRLESTHLQENGLLCWVQPASKKLTDNNGTSYAGRGPCVVFQSDSPTATIHVLLDYRKRLTTSPEFQSLKDDNDKIIMPVIGSDMVKPSQCTALVLSWPQGSKRDNFVADQYLVLCPSFKVPISELYQLPPCYLPEGTRISSDGLLYAQDYLSIVGSLVNACAKRREDRDVETNWLESSREEVERLKKTNEPEKAKVLEKSRQEVIRRRQNEKAQQEHEKLLQKVEEGLAKVRMSVDASAKAAVSKVPKTVPRQRGTERGTDPRMRRLDWMETRLILCAAMARLKEDGPIVVSENDSDVPNGHLIRSMLKSDIVQLLDECRTLPPTTPKREALRTTLAMTEEQWDPLTRGDKLLGEPTWEDFKTKKDDGEDETSDTGSSTSYQTSSNSSEGTQVSPEKG